MNRKKVLLLFLVLMLLVPVPLSFVKVKANSNNSMMLPGEVTLYSPVNTTYYSNFLSLNLSFGWGAGIQCKLTYDIDKQFGGLIPLTYNETANQGFQFIALENGYVQLPELSNGSHNLTINIEADLNDFHGANPPGAPFKQTSPDSANWVAYWIDKIDFTINSNENAQPSNTTNSNKNLIPSLSNLLIENTTYNTTNIPLNFTIDTNISRTAYSLDGKDNITITGNSTLTNLSIGEHNLKVYVWAVTGNIVASQTINFVVANATSTPIQDLEPLSMASIIAFIAAFAVGCALTFLFFFKNDKDHDYLGMKIIKFC